MVGTFRWEWKVSTKNEGNSIAIESSFWQGDKAATPRSSGRNQGVAAGRGVVAHFPPTYRAFQGTTPTPE